MLSFGEKEDAMGSCGALGWAGRAPPARAPLCRALAGRYLEEKSNPAAALNNSLVPGPSSSRR